MKVALRNNFPATVRAVERGLLLSTARAAQQTADFFGRQSQKSMRARMVQTGLGKMQGAVRYASSISKRGGRTNPNAVARRFGSGAKAWTVVYNQNNGDRSLGAFDAYTARSSTSIRPVNGPRWLAFPTGNIPRRVGKKKITPALWNSSALKTSIGPLVFIKGISPNVAYLAVKNVSVTGKTGSKARRLGKRGGVGRGRVKKELLIAFILIRATTRTRRFNPVIVLEQQMGPALLKFGELMSRERQAKPIPVQPLFSASFPATFTSVPVLRA